MQEVIFNQPLNWAEKVSDRLDKLHPAGPGRILHKAFFMLVSEVFTHLAIVFHATALAAKLPACLAWQALDKMTSDKTRQLIRKTPEYLTWQSLKTTHATPLLRSLAFSPLRRSGHTFSSHIFRQMKQELLNQPKPSLKRSIWNVVSSRPFVLTTLSVLGVGATYLAWTRYNNYQLAQQCHNNGDDWSILNRLTGQGSCNTERSERLAKEAEQQRNCETKGDVWVRPSELNNHEGACDSSARIAQKHLAREAKRKLDCQTNDGEWHPRSEHPKKDGWCEPAEAVRLREEQERRAEDCERRGGLITKLGCKFCPPKSEWMRSVDMNGQPVAMCIPKKPQATEVLAAHVQLNCPPIDAFPNVRDACKSGTPTRKSVFGTENITDIQSKKHAWAKIWHPDKTKAFPDCNFFWRCVSSLAGN